MNTLGSSIRFLAVAASLAVIDVSVVSAQSAPAKEYGSLLSINPLGLPFKYVSAESESRVTKMVTLGGTVSWLSVSDGSYLSLDAKLRIYPNEEAPKGFSIGVGAGATRITGNDIDGETSATRPTVSVVADYHWLLGKNKRFLVGAGVGAKRIFGDDVGFSGINFAYPTARFQVGGLF